ncbi:hypothetical protein KR215_007943, partial [Drosophila sulfurigaster]
CSFLDELKVGDIVFAKSRGHIAWPAKLIGRVNKTVARVEYILPEEKSDVLYKNIWLYNDANKKQFITKENLSYEAFATSIYYTERLLNTFPIYDDQRLLHQMLQQRDTLSVEPQFIAEINKLRSSLTKTSQNYNMALQAFAELLEMPQSQLMLVRNPEAVESIGKLCRFVQPESKNQMVVEIVRNKAKQQMQRFAAAFPKPYRKENFRDEYRLLRAIYSRHMTVTTIVKQSSTTEAKQTINIS